MVSALRWRGVVSGVPLPYSGNEPPPHAGGVVGIAGQAGAQHAVLADAAPEQQRDRECADRGGQPGAERQAVRLTKLRADRSSVEVERRLAALRRAGSTQENLMPFIYDAVKAYATLGEICDVLRDAFGLYEEINVT